jgi:hypothetical protein
VANQGLLVHEVMIIILISMSPSSSYHSPFLDLIAHPHAHAGPQKKKKKQKKKRERTKEGKRTVINK